MQNSLFDFFVLISKIGGQQIMVIFSVLISIIVFFYNKEKILAGFLFFNYMATMTIVIILKNLIEKPRSSLALVYENSYAFPSGHVASAMTTFLIIFYLSRFIKNNFWKNFSRLLGITWLLLIIIARLYLKVHDIYDVIGAIMVSSLVFYFSLKIKIFKNGILKEEFVKVEKIVKKEKIFLEKNI